MLLGEGIVSSAAVFVDVYTNDCNTDKGAFVFLTFLPQVAMFAQINAEEFAPFSRSAEDSVASVT